MNTDLTDQVHDAFVRRANDVEAPPIDHVAFEAQVGRARTRRRAGVAGAVAAVAAVSAVTLTAGLGLSDLTATPAPPVGSSAPDPAGPVAPLRSKVVWVDEGSVVLYGRPTIHRFDSDAFGRFEDAYRTVDGVLVVDAESGLVRITLSGNGSSKAPLSYRDVTAPVDGAVQAVGVSRDGRTAAWLTLGDQLVLHDLVEDETVATSEVSPGAAVLAAGEDRAVLWDRGRLVLRGDGAPLDVPTSDAMPRDADLAGQVLSVTEYGASGSMTTRFYDVGAGEPAGLPGGEVPAGPGALSADGTRYLAETPEAEEPALAENPAAVALFDTVTGERADFTGLPLWVHEYVWVDADTVAVTGSDLAGDGQAERRDVYTCDLGSMRCLLRAPDANLEDRAPYLVGGYAG